MATNLIQDAIASPVRKTLGAAQPKFKMNRAAIPVKKTSPVEDAATNMIQERPQAPSSFAKLTGKAASAADDQATIARANAAATEQKPASPGGSYEDDVKAWQKTVGSRSEEDQNLDREIKKEHLAAQRQSRLNERGAIGHVGGGGGSEMSAADKAKAAGDVTPMMGSRISKDASGKTVLDTGPTSLSGKVESSVDRRGNAVATSNSPSQTGEKNQTLVLKKSDFSGKTGITKAGSSVQIFNRAGSNVVNGRIVGNRPGSAVNTPENPNAEAAAHAQTSRRSGGDGQTIGKVIDDGRQQQLIDEARIATNKRNVAQHGTVAVDPRHAGPGQLTTDVARDPNTGALANVKAKGVKEGPGTPAIGGLPTKYVQGTGTGVDMAAAAANPTFAQAAPLQGASFLGTAPVSNGLEMKPTSQPLGINTQPQGSAPSLLGDQNITPTMAAVNQQVAQEEKDKTVAAGLKETDRTLAQQPPTPAPAPVVATPTVAASTPPPVPVVAPKAPNPGDEQAKAMFGGLNEPFLPKVGNFVSGVAVGAKNLLTGQTSFQKGGLIASGKQPRPGAVSAVTPYKDLPSGIASNDNAPEFKADPSLRRVAVETPATDNATASNPVPSVDTETAASVVKPKPQPRTVVQTAFKPNKNNLSSL